jgi:hypothetical protein
MINALVLTSLLVPMWGLNNVDAAQQVKYQETHIYNKFRNTLLERQLQIKKKETDENHSDEEIIDEEKNYIIEEELFYVDLDVPLNKPFKSYMDAKFITSEGSAQYQLKYNYTLDNTGIYMIDGRYACALGSYYTTDIGTKFDIIMNSGEIIPCILADCKADEHTDSLRQYTLGNGSIVEFVVNEPTLIPNISNQWGNTGDVSTLGGMFEGEISYIRIYF